MPRFGARRILRLLVAAVGSLLVLALLSFAIPVEEWRTGELPAPPLAVVAGGPEVSLPARTWIDTDAACGAGRTTDPDDCFALLMLLKDPTREVVGISTVHGNAALSVTDRTARALVSVAARDGGAEPPVFRGSARPLSEPSVAQPALGVTALRAALAAGPTTVIALGPLTNIAAALDGHPALQANVARLVAVMGRRPGHIFHPAEGAGEGGILFGHGPVFTDFNFAQDPEAARRLLAMGLPVSLLPYDAARGLSLTGDDLAALSARGGTAAWVADRSAGWLDYWRDDIGRPGFYPFDLIAAAYVLAPERFDCARAGAWIGEDEALWHLFAAPDALLVGPEPTSASPPSAAEADPAPEAGDPLPDAVSPGERTEPAHSPEPATAVAPSGTSVIYCPQTDPDLKPWLLAQLPM